jgi:energy-converting hydrogenase Eha subunit A
MKHEGHKGGHKGNIIGLSQIGLSRPRRFSYLNMTAFLHPVEDAVIKVINKQIKKWSKVEQSGYFLLILAFL